MTEAANEKPDRKSKNENVVSMGLKDSLITAGFFSIFALLVYGVGRFSWWVGLALYVLFIVYAISKFLTNGLAFAIGLLMMWVFYAAVRKWGVRPARFDDAAESMTKLVWVCLPMGIVAIYLLVLTGGLLWFFIAGLSESW
jgi:hypothetical protein